MVIFLKKTARHDRAPPHRFLLLTPRQSATSELGAAAVERHRRPERPEAIRRVQSVPRQLGGGRFLPSLPALVVSLRGPRVRLPEVRPAGQAVPQVRLEARLLRRPQV